MPPGTNGPTYDYPRPDARGGQYGEMNHHAPNAVNHKQQVSQMRNNVEITADHCPQSAAYPKTVADPDRPSLVGQNLWYGWSRKHNVNAIIDEDQMCTLLLSDALHSRLRSTNDNNFKNEQVTRLASNNFYDAIQAHVDDIIKQGGCKSEGKDELNKGIQDVSSS